LGNVLEIAMNERIQKLWAQAAFELNQEFFSFPDNWDELLREKFAELIVRECVDHIEDRVLASGGEGDWFEGYMDGARESCRLIKERFGVE